MTGNVPARMKLYRIVSRMIRIYSHVMKWVVAVLPLFFVSCKKDPSGNGAARQEHIEPQREYLVGTNFKYDLSKRLGERMEDHKGIKSLLQKGGLELGEGTGVTLAGDKLYMSATSGDHLKMAELIDSLNRGFEFTR